MVNTLSSSSAIVSAVDAPASILSRAVAGRESRAQGLSTADSVSRSSASVAEVERRLEGNGSGVIAGIEQAFVSGVLGEDLALGSDGRGLVGAGRGNAFNVPNDNESGRILVLSCEAESFVASSIDSVVAEELAQDARVSEHFGSASLTGASTRVSVDFFGSSEALRALSECTVPELDARDAGDAVVFSTVWYRGIDEFLHATLLDFRGGATSGKSFKVGDKGVTFRVEDCSG